MKKIFLYIFLIITSLITLVPFIWMLAASFMVDGNASVFPPIFIPDPFTVIQYKVLFERLNVARNFFNSLFLSMTVTIISLFFNSMAGYAFAKYRFKGKNQLFNPGRQHGFKQTHRAVKIIEKVFLRLFH